MSFVKELLKLAYERFPIMDKTQHAIVLDNSSDQLTLILSAYGALIPIGFTDDELEKDPKDVMDEIYDLVMNRSSEG